MTKAYREVEAAASMLGHMGDLASPALPTLNLALQNRVMTTSTARKTVTVYSGVNLALPPGAALLTLQQLKPNDRSLETTAANLFIQRQVGPSRWLRFCEINCGSRSAEISVKIQALEKRYASSKETEITNLLASGVVLERLFAISRLNEVNSSDPRLVTSLKPILETNDAVVAAWAIAEAGRLGAQAKALLVEVNETMKGEGDFKIVVAREALKNVTTPRSGDFFSK